MGEYAEMILDGTCCQGCGEYLGDGDGFPVYCSACAKQARRNDPDAPFIVKAEKAFSALPHWLREKSPNTYSIGASDKRGKPIINVSSDVWRGEIIVIKRDLFERTETMVAEYIQKQRAV